MADYQFDLHLSPGEKIEVRPRINGMPGCAISFGTGAIVYLTPTQRAELMQEMWRQEFPADAMLRPVEISADPLGIIDPPAAILTARGDNVRALRPQRPAPFNGPGAA